MRTLEPIFVEGDSHYYLCPRFGEAMREENINQKTRKCPNSYKNSGKYGCREICYYKPPEGVIS